jgi:hypothetical protein
MLSHSRRLRVPRLCWETGRACNRGSPRAPKALIIAAISMGAIYRGAMTISATRQNFMAYAIAVERGIKMPRSSATWSGRATCCYPLWHCSFVVTGKLW